MFAVFADLSLYRDNLYPRKFMNSRRVQYYGFEANGVEDSCMLMCACARRLEVRPRK